VSNSQLAAGDATASSRASFDGYRSWTTSRVRPWSSSKVAVVTTVPPSPSSLVQTRRAGGVTSRYRPKNAIGSAAPVAEGGREPPPTPASISHDSSLVPYDFRAHHPPERSASL